MDKAGCPRFAPVLWALTWDQQYFHSRKKFSVAFFVVLGPIPMFGLGPFQIPRALGRKRNARNSASTGLLIVEFNRAEPLDTRMSFRV